MAMQNSGYSIVCYARYPGRPGLSNEAAHVPSLDPIELVTPEKSTAPAGCTSAPWQRGLLTEANVKQPEEHIITAADRIAKWLESVLPKDDPNLAEAVAFVRHAANRLEILSDGYEDYWVWPQPMRDPAKSVAALRELLLQPQEDRYAKGWIGRRPEGE
jgi:hypothetical protein